MASLWASGLVLRARRTQAAEAMMLPIVLPMFFAPSLVPRNLLTDWLHSVADVNPLTAMLESGRGLLAGHPFSIALAFGAAAGLLALARPRPMSGLRAARPVARA